MYLREGCKGQGRKDRIERLLQEFLESAAAHKVDEATARKIIEEYTQPNEAAFERFKNRFLLADHPLNRGRFDASVRYEEALEKAGRDVGK